MRLLSMMMDGDARGNYVFDKYKHIVNHNAAVQVPITKVGVVVNVGQVIVRLDSGSGSSFISEKQHELFYRIKA